LSGTAPHHPDPGRTSSVQPTRLDSTEEEQRVTTSAWRIAREIFLSVAAAVGVICLVGSALMLVTGVTPVVFRSGSMAPAMPTGALALVQDRAARTVSVGDVVSTIGGTGIRTTHRVVDLRRASDGRMTLVTRGDANDTDDASQRTVSRVDVVIWSAPMWGYAVTALQHPFVVFAGGAITGSWLTWWAVTRRNDRRPPRVPHAAPTTYSRDRSAARVVTLPVTVLVLAGLTAGVGLVGSTQGTRASFVSDSARASSTFGVDKLGTRIARTLDVTRATNGQEGGRLGPAGATTWTAFVPPPFRPTSFSAEGALNVAFNGRNYAYYYVGGTWQTRELPASRITAVMATANAVAPVVMATDGVTWWYSDHPKTQGTPGAWTVFRPTNPPTGIIDSDSAGRRNATTDGTTVKVSDYFGNTWTTAVPLPSGSATMVAYSGLTILVWGSGGWWRSIDNGASWAADAVLNARVPLPTDITGGTGVSPTDDNRFVIARGTSGIWRYDGRLQTLTPVEPPY
jgi:signal peptidase I